MKHLLFLVLFYALTYSQVATADWLVGVKGGSMIFDVDNAEDDPINGSLLLGYGFRSGITYEIEATRDYESGIVAGAEVEIESQALYITYRSSGKWFFKIRGGLIQSSFDGDLQSADTEQSYGAGLGIRFGRLDLALDYTTIDDDIAFAALGVLFWF